MSQLLTISADDSCVDYSLSAPPSEVKELAQTFNMTLSRLSAQLSKYSDNLLAMFS